MKGFTFLEIILAISILSIVSGSVIFSYIALDKTYLMRDSEKVKNSIEEIKFLSLIYNQLYYLEFYPENNSYQTYKNTNYVKEELEYVYLDNIENISSNSIPSNLISFNEDGITASACTITINSKWHEVKLTVNVGSGNVKMGNIYLVE